MVTFPYERNSLARGIEHQPTNQTNKQASKQTNKHVDTLSLPMVDRLSLPMVYTYSVPMVDTLLLPMVGTVSLPMVDTLSLPMVNTLSLPMVDTLSLPMVNTLSLPMVDTAFIKVFASCERGEGGCACFKAAVTRYLVLSQGASCLIDTSFIYSMLHVHPLLPLTHPPTTRYQGPIKTWNSTKHV